MGWGEQQQPINLGSGHCCACAGLCYHVSPPTYCARHQGQPVTYPPPPAYPIVITPAPRSGPDPTYIEALRIAAVMTDHELHRLLNDPTGPSRYGTDLWAQLISVTKLRVNTWPAERAMLEGS